MKPLGKEQLLIIDGTKYCVLVDYTHHRVLVRSAAFKEKFNCWDILGMHRDEWRKTKPRLDIIDIVHYMRKL